jgi:hypothetical protein
MKKAFILAVITYFGLAISPVGHLFAADSNNLGPTTTANGQPNTASGNTLQPQGSGLQNAPVGDNQTAPTSSGASLQAGGDLNSAAITNYLQGETTSASTANPPFWTQERIMTLILVTAILAFAVVLAWQLKYRPFLPPYNDEPIDDNELDAESTDEPGEEIPAEDDHDPELDSESESLVPESAAMDSRAEEPSDDSEPLEAGPAVIEEPPALYQPIPAKHLHKSKRRHK